MRWEEQPDGCFWAYSGVHIIGMVVPVGAGPLIGKVAWKISAVTPSKYQAATDGYCKTVTGAKAAFCRQWLTWLRERGLAEVS